MQGMLTPGLVTKGHPHVLPVLRSDTKKAAIASKWYIQKTNLSVRVSYTVFIFDYVPPIFCSEVARAKRLRPPSCSIVSPEMWGKVSSLIEC